MNLQEENNALNKAWLSLTVIQNDSPLYFVFPHSNFLLFFYSHSFSDCILLLYFMMLLYISVRAHVKTD